MTFLASSLTRAAESSATAETTPLGWFFVAVFVLGTALMLFCVLTIYRNPYFNELQKVGWLILTLGFPVVGPIAWLIRARLEKKHRESPHYVSDEEAARRREEAGSAVHPEHRAGQSRLFAPSSQRHDTVTTDSPENPYLTQNKDGSRGLNF